MNLPLVYIPPGGFEGCCAEELEAAYPGYDQIRQIERASIRHYVEQQRGYLVGRVLDYGAGRRPYADLVCGTYEPFERGCPEPIGPFDCILCTQVLQFLGPVRELERFRDYLLTGGYLVLTYPTNWDESDPEDLWRYTKAGMERLLTDRGFRVLDHQKRAEVRVEGFRFPLGYGCVAQKL